MSVQQSEAEDDQHTHVCGLEIENIYSTIVFILGGFAGAGSCSIKSVVMVDQRSAHKPTISSGEHYL